MTHEDTHATIMECQKLLKTWLWVMLIFFTGIYYLANTDQGKPACLYWCPEWLGWLKQEFCCIRRTKWNSRNATSIRHTTTSTFESLMEMYTMLMKVKMTVLQIGSKAQYLLAFPAGQRFRRSTDNTYSVICWELLWGIYTIRLGNTTGVLPSFCSHCSWHM